MTVHQVEVSMEDIEFYEPEFRNIASVVGVTSALESGSLTPDAEATLAKGFRDHQPLLRKYISVIRGPMKGYHGYVRAIDNGLATVEIEAMQGSRTLIAVRDLQLLTETTRPKESTSDASGHREKTPEPSSIPWTDLTLEETNDFGPLLEQSPLTDDPSGM